MGIVVGVCLAVTIIGSLGFLVDTNYFRPIRQRRRRNSELAKHLEVRQRFVLNSENPYERYKVIIIGLQEGYVLFQRYDSSAAIWLKVSMKAERFVAKFSPLS